MEEESIEEKQLFLRTEIITKGYDGREFSIFLANLKGEEKVDLEFWTLEDLKKAVETFKESKLRINNEEEEKEERNSSDISGEKGKNNKTNKKHKFQFLRNLLKPKKYYQNEDNNININEINI